MDNYTHLILNKSEIIMTIKIYADPGSGSCRRVSAVIKHLDIEVEEIFIDLLSGENRTDDFLSINPNGMVPVMVIENEHQKKIILSEAAAIMIYLCEQYGDTELLPGDDSRLQVLKWMFWAAEHFRQPAPIYFEEKVFAPLMGNEENSSRLEEADRLIETHAAILNTHLENRKYVVGDHATLADFDLAAALSQMPRSNVPYDRYENIMTWAINLESNVDAWRITGENLNERMNSALS